MNVIFVSRSKTGKPLPFVKEQADFLTKNFQVDVQHFLISKGGVFGYLTAILQLRDFVQKKKPDIVHVHYGLWALVAVFSKLISLSKHKIIITFHGSDINKQTERYFGLLASYLASHSILVSPKMVKYFKSNYSIIPCGVDTNVNQCDRHKIRFENGWGKADFVILFSSSFNRPVKDPEFAFKVVDAFSKVSPRPVRFIELKGYTRDQLNGIMQAADALILSSIMEGSPQVIKESIINSLPIVSNNVGDVAAICSGIDNCFIINKEVDAYVRCLQSLSSTQNRITNRTPVLERFDNNIISKQIFEIYSTVLTN
ncbi:glycosyltransferase family 4 protein [Pontibacter roseus]|uniref:glycosyltransferase family 4 protein n=1 Tax=Pontibacter roseus TaxID=336989 RepID=UPI00036C15FB|nr:glycosyltransferase family 4 protein [Pontibacter roseus]